MKRLLLFFLLSIIVFSCSEEQKKQFEHAGGKLTMALENEPSTLIPRKVMDHYSSTVLTQINEGLVGIDNKTTKIVPRLATKWTKSADGKIYTFTLRKGVMFHSHKVFSSDKDRIMTAQDVKYSFEKACSPDEKGQEPSAYNFFLKDLVQGANEFYERKAKSISGLKIKGNKVTFTLIHSDHNFLYKLATINAAIISKKASVKGYETDVVGTGPFVYDSYAGGDQPRLTLTKNEDYYLKDKNGNALPYLDQLVFVFERRKLEQLEMFENGELDMILGLPTSRITRMLEGKIEDFNSKPPRLIMANNPKLEVNYYFFNLKDERFKDPRVRKAFNYAVDKEVIGREILRNQYHDLGFYGITPPIGKVLKGYDFKGLSNAGYEYDPEKARKLLAEAGFPNGEGFGSVHLRYNINEVHSAVADEFSKQIGKVLNVNVNIDGSSFEDLINDGERGNGDIFRLGWTADYPSPESFLANFYGKNVPNNETEPSRVNKARYKNPIFDEYFERAIDTKKQSDQMKYFSQAEVAMMQDPPIIPLWYTGDIGIIQSYVRNYYFNALNHVSFTDIYIKKWTKSEYEKAYQKKPNVEK